MEKFGFLKIVFCVCVGTYHTSYNHSYYDLNYCYLLLYFIRTTDKKVFLGETFLLSPLRLPQLGEKTVIRKDQLYKV
jgi:hypothetical protein